MAITILRQGQAPAAAKPTHVVVEREVAVPALKLRKAAASSAELAKRIQQVMPTDKVIRRESRVSHATKKDPTAAVRRARWRKRNPEQHRDQQRAARARRKAGKAVGS